MHAQFLAALGEFRKDSPAFGSSPLELFLSVSDEAELAVEDRAKRLGLCPIVAIFIVQDFEREGVMTGRDGRVLGMTDQGRRLTGAILSAAGVVGRR